MKQKLRKAGHALAAEHVKSAFSSYIATGRRRGGRASAVLNRASAAAQAAACVFADYFADCERDFDPSAFFRACSLSEGFIQKMSRARTLYDLKKATETRPS